MERRAIKKLSLLKIFGNRPKMFRKLIILSSMCIFALELFGNPATVALLSNQAIGESKVPDTDVINISAENIQRDIRIVQSFGNRTTWEKQWQTARWLEKTLQSSGISVRLQTYEYKGKSWPNVIAELPGKDHTGQKIIAMAHLDSINDNDGSAEAPGADDNGSGMAIILELARNLRHVALDRTVMLCIFSNEEQGLAGSSTFVKEQKKSGTDIKAVINLDTLGYNRPSSPYYFDATTSLESWKKRYVVSKIMLRNYVDSFILGKNSIQVAGRPKNLMLVETTARELAKISALNIKSQVKDDCG
jgi:hypothetical protein